MYLGNYTEEQYSAILDQDSLDILRELFNRMDDQGDLIVRRGEFLKALRVTSPHQTDAMVRTLLDRNVFYVGVLEKHITLAQVVRFMEDELVENIKFDPRGQEFITWGETETYLKTLRKKLVMRLGEDADREFTLQISPEYLQLLKDVFDSVPRVIDGIPS